MQQLGIDGQVAGRLRPFPNGATAMREMAQCPQAGLVGCTQMTEILYTPGVSWVASLPEVFELATVYTAAVCRSAANPKAATAMVALLSGPEAANQRRSAGFE